MNKLHHIGVAAKDIEQAKQEYMARGYLLEKQLYDPTQKARLALLTKTGETRIELVCATEKESPVYSLCQNKSPQMYHKCYQVENLEQSITQHRQRGWLLVSSAVYAPLLNGTICFMFSKEEGLVEFYEIHI